MNTKQNRKEQKKNPYCDSLVAIFAQRVGISCLKKKLILAVYEFPGSRFQPLSRRKEKPIVIRIPTRILAATLPGGSLSFTHAWTSQGLHNACVRDTSLKSPFFCLRFPVWKRNSSSGSFSYCLIINKKAMSSRVFLSLLFSLFYRRIVSFAQQTTKIRNASRKYETYFFSKALSIFKRFVNFW